ncbi:MAG: hypothetical protein LBI13_03285 [Streptococcaceae bacterium]|jgi:hypothetical protein|nr:hypothetical protein [Streptococcaceae bacterium]
MDNLSFIFEKTDNPFLKEQNGSQYDLWGSLTLKYGDKILLECEWEMHNWILSFLDKKEILETENYPFEYINSIAESRDTLFGRIDYENGDDEKIYAEENILEEYFPNHYFKLMGIESQSFYIGLNPDGVGEISYYVEDEDKYYKYEFDMPTFVKQADQAIINYLKKFQLTLVSDEEYFKKFFGEEYSKYIGENARLDAMSFGF